MNNTILVTGGAGYIGSHVCKELARCGYNPVSYDNLSRGHEWAVKWGPLVIGEILDQEKLLKVIKKYDPIAVMHFAAFAYVSESVENPLLYYQNNISGSLCLFKAMTISNVRSIIFSSSCAIYGLPISQPIVESNLKTPISPYGRTKLIIEEILKDFEIAYGIKSISLRYFNAAGADPDGEIGEIHDPETHLIPNLLKTAVGERKHLEIYGSNHETKDGTCVRDYIHINDLANAHVLALEKLLSDQKSNQYNLGTGKGYSIKEILNVAREITGEVIKYKMMSARIGDPPILVADSKKFRNETGWEPENSTVNKIILDAYKWEESVTRVKPE